MVMKSNENKLTSGSQFWTMVLSLIVLVVISVTIPACIDEDDGTGPVLNLPRIHVSDMTVAEEDDDFEDFTNDTTEEEENKK